MAPFVIFAMPRSRSFWISKFLQYPPWQCGHDEARHLRSLDDVRSWFAQPHTGTVETACAPFWRLLPPGVRVATVRRPVPDVVASLAGAGLTFDPAVMTRLIERAERKLDQIERRLPSVLSMRFEDLASEATCAQLFEHCLGLPHDHAWWEAVSPLNLQASLPHQVQYFAAHRSQLEKLAKQAKHRTLAGMERLPELDGVTFAVEPFASFYEEAKPLFAEHLVQTEQSPDDHMRKNLPLLQRLDEMGALQVVTGKSNGRLFGYLMSVIGPSLDEENRLVALHTIFFASPLIRNLGMGLQRAALGFLRARGVAEVQMRAGHRGSGPRLGTFYRRLGAEHFGTLYRLELH